VIVAASNVVRIAGRGVAKSTTRNVVVRGATMTAVMTRRRRRRRRRMKADLMYQSFYYIYDPVGSRDDDEVTAKRIIEEEEITQPESVKYPALPVIIITNDQKQEEVEENKT
jgi:hypothetical protein